MISEIWSFLKNDHDAVLALVAIISAFTALMALKFQEKISRAQRIADNRVRWVELLREEVACCLTDLTRLTEIEEDYVKEPTEEYPEQANQLYDRFYKSKLKITLSLNYEECEHVALIAAIENAYEVSTNLVMAHGDIKNRKNEKLHAQNLQKFKDAKNELTIKAQKVFKAEWIKAKEGK